MLNPDDIMLWPDGCWVFTGEFCWETDNWMGDDYRILVEDSEEWRDLLKREGYFR